MKDDKPENHVMISADDLWNILNKSTLEKDTLEVGEGFLPIQAVFWHNGESRGFLFIRHPVELEYEIGTFAYCRDVPIEKIRELEPTGFKRTITQIISHVLLREPPKKDSGDTDILSFNPSNN